MKPDRHKGWFGFFKFSLNAELLNSEITPLRTWKTIAVVAAFSTFPTVLGVNSLLNFSAFLNPFSLVAANKVSVTNLEQLLSVLLNAPYRTLPLLWILLICFWANSKSTTSHTDANNRPSPWVFSGFELISVIFVSILPLNCSLNIFLYFSAIFSSVLALFRVISFLVFGIRVCRSSVWSDCFYWGILSLIILDKNNYATSKILYFNFYIYG